MQARAVFKAVPEGQLRDHQGRQGRRRTPTSCARADERDHRSAAVDVRRHQDRRRDLHRRLEARHRPDRNGAVPDGQQQQGRRRPVRERRHGRRRRRGARRPRASTARSPSRARTATRPPSTASRSAPRPSTSGRTRASSARPPARPRSQLCNGHGRRRRSPARRPFTTPKRQHRSESILLKPIPITKDNLKVVVDAGWITKDVLCKGVTAGVRRRPAA